MPRSVNNVAAKKRRKKILKAAKGYRGSRSKLYKVAKDSVEKGWLYAYRDRKQRKRDFRQLWIARINAAARMCGMSYSKFMNGLKKANVGLNRKVLAELAVNDFDAFKNLVEKAKATL